MADQYLVWVRSKKPTPWGLKDRRHYVVNVNTGQVNTSKMFAARMPVDTAERLVARLAHPDREVQMARESRPATKESTNG